MTPFKIISAGVLEIKGSYSNSSTMYVRSEYVQGFVVNHRSSSIELLFANGFPNKIVDCTGENLATSVAVLTEFTSLKNLKPSALITMQEKLTTSINDVHHLIGLIGENKLDQRFGDIEKDINDLCKDIENLKNSTSILGSSITNIHSMMPVPDEDADADAEEEDEEAEEEAETDKNGLFDDTFSAEILIATLATFSLLISGLVIMFHRI